MKFNPSRLVLARKRRAFSKSALSKKCKLSVRSLGYYESGHVTPSEDAINSLADTLEFPSIFFFGSDIEEVSCDSVSFRSLSSMTASQRDLALAAGTLATVFENWIRERFDLPKQSVPSLSNFDPETAAEILRVEWGLGQRPISNVVHLAEAKGIRVFSSPIDSISIDAFSAWHNGIPFIFLNPTKSGERGRMDVSHEIAHLCMHRHGVPRSQKAEFEARQFASAFLMPAKDVLANASKNISLKTIQKLKTRWKVAAIALVVRLYVLNILTEWQYRSFCIELSRTGQRKKELNGTERESSQILGKVFVALRSEAITRKAIACDLAITLNELNSLVAGLTIAAVPSISSNTDYQEINSAPPNKPILKIV